LKNYNILITGHKGFIGSSLLLRLENMGLVKNKILLFEKEDIDNNNWKNTLNDYVKSSDIIFHIGADSNTQNENFNEVLFYNYYFSKILFDIAKNSETKVIYSSSAACYGTENLPENIYGWSKYLAEQYGHSILDKFISLRYFNVYGPGENHKGLMASVANQAMKSDKETFNLFPGKPKRDFVYIDDVVNANIVAMTSEVSKGIFDVGSGVQNSFEKVLQVLGKKFSYHDRSLIPEGYQYSTIANRNNFLPDWVPEYDLERGLKKYKKVIN
jgi:ADP-L-glycero-D-manno-heptose 6-epimerase